jgi:prepilin-type N-terminal cleavage/methylation domain-containing protein
MRRAFAGFTLLELLAAVALMGMVVAGSGWFVRTASERSIGTADALRRSSAVDALFDSIDRDLLLGDSSLPDSIGPKLRVTESTLAIVTRATTTSAGAVVHDYAFRAASGTGEVLSSERPVDRDALHGAVAMPQPVLGSVKSFTVALEPRSRVLTVTLAVQDGLEVERRWTVP